MQYSTSDRARRNIIKFIAKACGFDLRKIARKKFDDLVEWYNDFVKSLQGRMQLQEARVVNRRNLRKGRRR